jgi:Lon protease-like protein
MPERLLPLFPLGVVLFPRTVLPLHIFEERYKEMIGTAIRDQTEFGVVQAGDKGIVNMGCTATVDKITKRYPDGRMDILALGRRRFEIHELNDEKDYLRGEVTFFEDEAEDEPPRELRVRALTEFTAIRPLSETEVSGEPAADDPKLSFKFSQVFPYLVFVQFLV